MRTWIKWIVLLLILAALGALATGWWSRRRSSSAVVWRTADVERGKIVATISATGTLEPEEVVDVGAQVAGQINSFGKDVDGQTIDYRSPVDVGTILAQIDPSVYQADLEQANAQLGQANAGVLLAQAGIDQARAKLDQARRDWDRAQKLGPSDALSQSQFDAYQSAHEVAKADLSVAEASLVQSQQTVVSAQAGVDRARRNVEYTTIKSPVSGIIIDRRVNIGQTVVSSLSAPSLFLIAKDLKKMQIWVAVNEADIDHVSPGQPVTFTIAGLSGRIFHGTVSKVRLNAMMTQNVVTYTVVVTLDNSDGTLLPYRTASVSIEVDRADDILTVPNAALRWIPAPGRIDPSVRDTVTDASRRSDDSTVGRDAYLWTPHGDFVRPVPVRAGLTDGTSTAVTGADLHEGLVVVLGEQTPGAPTVGGANPFLPQMRRSSAGK